jgi:hypothetical protein
VAEDAAKEFEIIKSKAKQRERSLNCGEYNIHDQLPPFLSRYKHKVNAICEVKKEGKSNLC